MPKQPKTIKYSPADERLLLEYWNNHHRAWQYPSASDLTLCRKIVAAPQKYGDMMEMSVCPHGDLQGRERFRLTPVGRARVGKDL
jgi:hypothetical protein